MLPLSRSGRVRAPWPPSSCARLLYPLPRPVTGVTSDQLGSASLSTVRTASRLVAFTLQDPTIDRGPRHSFRSLMAGVARPRPRDGRYPSSSRRKRTPWPPPTSTRLLLCGTRAIARSDLSTESRRSSSRRFSNPIVRLSTSRFSGPRRPRDDSGHRHPPRILRSAYYP